jgi:Protein of unknown function (DUF4025)
MSNPYIKRRKYVCIHFLKGVFFMNKKNMNDSTEIAGRTFHTSDYQKNDSLSSGLATTHEQVSDTYMEGEIGAVIDNGPEKKSQTQE